MSDDLQVGVKQFLVPVLGPTLAGPVHRGRTNPDDGVTLPATGPPTWIDENHTAIVLQEGSVVNLDGREKVTLCLFKNRSKASEL